MIPIKNDWVITYQTPEQQERKLGKQLWYSPLIAAAPLASPTNHNKAVLETAVDALEQALKTTPHTLYLRKLTVEEWRESNGRLLEMLKRLVRPEKWDVDLSPRCSSGGHLLVFNCHCGEACGCKKTRPRSREKSEFDPKVIMTEMSPMMRLAPLNLHTNPTMSEADESGIRGLGHLLRFISDGREEGVERVFVRDFGFYDATLTPCYGMGLGLENFYYMPPPAPDVRFLPSDMFAEVNAWLRSINVNKKKGGKSAWDEKWQYVPKYITFGRFALAIGQMPKQKSEALVKSLGLPRLGSKDWIIIRSDPRWIELDPNGNPRPDEHLVNVTETLGLKWEDLKLIPDTPKQCFKFMCHACGVLEEYKNGSRWKPYEFASFYNLPANPGACPLCGSTQLLCLEPRQLRCLKAIEMRFKGRKFKGPYKPSTKVFLHDEPTQQEYLQRHRERMMHGVRLTISENLELYRQQIRRELERYKPYPVEDTSRPPTGLLHRIWHARGRVQYDKLTDTNLDGTDRDPVQPRPWRTPKQIARWTLEALLRIWKCDDRPKGTDISDRTFTYERAPAVERPEYIPSHEAEFFADSGPEFTCSLHPEEGKWKVRRKGQMLYIGVAKDENGNRLIKEGKSAELQAIKYCKKLASQAFQHRPHNKYPLYRPFELDVEYDNRPKNDPTDPDCDLTKWMEEYAKAAALAAAYESKTRPENNSDTKLTPKETVAWRRRTWHLLDGVGWDDGKGKKGRGFSLSEIFQKHPVVIQSYIKGDVEYLLPGGANPTMVDMSVVERQESGRTSSPDWDDYDSGDFSERLNEHEVAGQLQYYREEAEQSKRKDKEDREEDKVNLTEILEELVDGEEVEALVNEVLGKPDEKKDEQETVDEEEPEQDDSSEDDESEDESEEVELLDLNDKAAPDDTWTFLPRPVGPIRN